MKKLLLASATALSMAAVPAAAQIADGPEATTASVADKRSDMSPEQRAMYDSWPADQRSAFDEWDADRQVLYFGWTDALRGYYWNLEAEQQDAWWYLTDEQRISLFQLQGEQRELAWNAVLEQVAALEARNPASTSPAVHSQRSVPSSSS